jgi:hypothetical protein
MTITLNFALWTLLTLGIASSAALVVAARNVDSATEKPVWLPLGAAAGILLAAIFGADPQALFNRSPYGMYLLQSCLPVAGLALTAYLACRWYIYRPGHGAAIAGLRTTFLAVLVAAGATVLFVMPETALGLAMALMIALILGGLSARLPVAALRAAGLTAASCSLWAAGFLVYLTVFPEQIAVGMEQPAEDGRQLPIAETITLLALAAAFILGFLKRRRG